MPKISIFLELKFFLRFIATMRTERSRRYEVVLFAGKRAQTRGTRSRMFVWGSVNVAMCIVYRITARFPPRVIRSLSILKELVARRCRPLKNTQGKLACWLYVQHVRVLVCKERTGLAGISRMLYRLHRSHFRSVGIIISTKRCFHQLCNVRPAPTLFLKQIFPIGKLVSVPNYFHVVVDEKYVIEIQYCLYIVNF